MNSKDTINMPKFINLNNAITHDLRTLVWLQNQSSAINWSKWDCIVTSIESYNYWSELNTHIVGMVITEVHADNTDDFIDKLYEISKSISMILLSQNILDLKSNDFWSDNFDNILNLDNIIDTYPFINKQWDNTVSDAVCIFGMLCRYDRIIDCKVTDGRISSLTKNMSFEYDIIPNEIWLVTQFYKHTNKRRYGEIKSCLVNNLLCPYIDKIVLINEKDYSDEYNKLFCNTEKILQVVTGNRLLYSDFLVYVRDVIPNNVYVILSNADMYFDDTITELWKIDMNNKMLCLLRWNVDIHGHSTLFGPRADSQDSWICLSNTIKSKNIDYSLFNYHLGMPGCDNAFAGHILKHKILISNPSMSIKSYHLHNSNIRNYNTSSTIKANVYINLAPTYILDIKQTDVPSYLKPDMITNESIAFEIRSSSELHAISFCDTLEKEGRYSWKPNTVNHYFESTMSIHKWKNAFVTPNGLVYDFNNVYKGKHSDNPVYNYWIDTHTDIWTPLHKCDKMLALPFRSSNIFNNINTYILYYFSRYIRLHKLYSNLSFWLPFEYKKYIKQWFNLNDIIDKYSVEYDTRMGCWANEVVGLLPGPSSIELGVEDIRELRSQYPSWVEYPNRKVCAVFVDSTMTKEFIENRLVKCINNIDSEWIIHYIYDVNDVNDLNDLTSLNNMMSGIMMCIFIGTKQNESLWSKLWCLPKKCCIIEYQYDTTFYGDFQHIAHISELKSWIIPITNKDIDTVHRQILIQTNKWFQNNTHELYITQ